jgi:hypothetical protein
VKRVDALTSSEPDLVGEAEFKASIKGAKTKSLWPEAQSKSAGNSNDKSETGLFKDESSWKGQ